MGLNISSSDGGVKKSTPYTPEQADMYAKMTTSPFMAALGDLTGIENNNDFNNVAMSYVKGVDPDKLSRYLEKPLGNSTVEGVNALLV
jgi:hypothetical protein